MRRTFLVGHLVCLALSLPANARAQASDDADAGTPSEHVEPAAGVEVMSASGEDVHASPVGVRAAPGATAESLRVEAMPVSGDEASSDAMQDVEASPPEVAVEPERPGARSTVVRGKSPPPPDSPERRDPTGAITVIDATARTGEARDSAELLVGSVGLAVQDSGGYGQSKSLVVRGAASNGVLVFLDGIPLNGAGGMADLSQVPAALVERFEVLRGGAGARYGSGGLGGAVNIVTRAPSAHARASGEVTYGSWNTALGHVAVTGPLLDGHGLVLLHAGRSDGDFAYELDELPAVDDNPVTAEARARNDAQGGGVLLRYRRRLPGGSRLDVLSELALEDRAIPGTVQNPQSAGRQDLDRLSLGVRWSGALGGAGTQGSARGFFRRDGLEVTGGLLGAGGPQRHLVGGVELEGRLPLGGAHTLTTTVASSGEQVTEARGSQSAGWWRGSVMAMDEWALFGGVLDVVPSLRLERVGPYWLFSPKLGAAVSLGGGFGLRANAGQSHRAPSFLELYIRQGTLLPNPGLKPERALYADTALVWDSEETVSGAPRWSATAGGFAALYENLIAYELYPPMMARPYNFDAARVWGVELEGEARPFSWLSASGSYTWLRTQNRLGDPRYYNQDLPYRPRHKWVGRVRAGPDWLNARTEVLYQASQLVNRTGTRDLPSRTLWSVGASSTFLHAPDVTVSIEVKNLLDSRAQDFTGFPLPGRAAYATLAVAFDAHPASPPSSEDSHAPRAPSP